MPELFAEIRSAQREFDGGFEEAQLITGVVTIAFEQVGINRLLFKEQADAVSKLNFASAARAGFLQNVEDFGCQDIPANDRKV